MIGLPLAFGAPLVLAGLIALPIIWWLLRLTPPKPSQEVFPPLKILARILKKDETPHKSPWWLTLLRLALSALVILALAEPVLNPQSTKLSGEGPLVLVIDNSWPSALSSENQKRTALNLINAAESASRPVILAALASDGKTPLGPFDAAAARERLAAVKPEPVPTDARTAAKRVIALAGENKANEIIWLDSGLESKDKDEALESIGEAGFKSLSWHGPETMPLSAVTATENGAETLKIILQRAAGAPDAGPGQLLALDEKGRQLAETPFLFTGTETSLEAELKLPFELRNDIASVRIAGERHAGAVRLLDDRMKRKRVALLSGASNDAAQPLLSALYYIERAIAPFADIIQPRSSEISAAITEFLEAKPSVIIMADVGSIPAPAEAALKDWIEKGGMLVRFAGPRLAASTDDKLLPVALRRGERALDGTMSWTVPQGLLPFGELSPFAGVEIAPDIAINRQVLALPEPNLAERSWADLADGTPLVTASEQGRGRIVLFHVTPNTSWSNLPLTGTFVEMLRRTINLAQAAAGGALVNGQTVLPPFRAVSAEGIITPPAPTAQPLALKAGAAPAVTFENPPGLYGNAEGAVALPLLGKDDRLVLSSAPKLPFPVTAQVYQSSAPQPLKGAMLLAALALLALDCIAVLWMTGAFRSWRPNAASASLALILLMPLADRALAQQSPPAAQPPAVSSADAIEAISQTRLAFVKTGDSQIDKVSQDGLFGLTVFLRDKTALEPGEPIGIDLDTDELAFFPVVYWPIDAASPVPSANAIARADAYMRQGGTILFDTRDQDIAAFDLAGGGSAANERLRAILNGMNVPPLEPVPSDHVLTKSFYLLTDFPGRYKGGDLWVEASATTETLTDRPVRTGDGVSPILITSNDFASAWAMDDNGNFLYSTVPADNLQREHAFRTGINIVMYMLTGNYKSDQVHIPALLERLGQ
jgi:Domain of unknown function (DUF4159)/Aerotolerance regulator N-terminal